MVDDDLNAVAGLPPLRVDTFSSELDFVATTESLMVRSSSTLR